jgi:hypothetical protein
MKNAMPTRKSIGKISRFLRTVRGGSGGQTETRRIIRGTSNYPSSVKVGAGAVTARRSCSNLILHKRDHRSKEVIGNGMSDKGFSKGRKD